MIKKLLFNILVCTIIFLFALENNALAHTGLESSIPSEGEVITETLEQVTLTFETKVEQSSSFKVQNSKGELIPLKGISISENQMMGNFEKPLENSEYQLIWEIIGADGHPINGEFSFSVDVPNSESVEDNEQSNPQVEEQKQDATTSDVKEEENREIASSEAVQQNKMPSYVIPSIIGLLALIVIGSFILLGKKKRNP